MGIPGRRPPPPPETGQPARQPLEEALRADPNHPATTDAVLLDDNQDLHPKWIRAR